MVRHTWRSNQLCVTRMMLLVEQGKPEMKSECCDEVEQRWGYADTEVGWLWGLCKWVRYRYEIITQSIPSLCISLLLGGLLAGQLPVFNLFRGWIFSFSSHRRQVALTKMKFGSWHQISSWWCKPARVRLWDPRNCKFCKFWECRACTCIAQFLTKFLRFWNMWWQFNVFCHFCSTCS